MKKSKASNLEGFVVRRRPSINDRRLGLDNLKVPSKYLLNPELKNNSPNDQERLQRITDDMSESQPLHVAEDERRSVGAAATKGIRAPKGDSLGSNEPDKSAKRRFPSLRDLRKPTKKELKVAGIVLLVLTIILAGFFIWKFIVNGGRVFGGNPLGLLLGNKELQKDQYGRTNILLFGTSEDDPDHAGADLTDSILIASLSQEKKDAYLLSVPRDLWVKYGKACNAGYEGKINEVYLCNKSLNGEKAGQEALEDKVSEVFGIDLQYTVHLNYTVLKEAVDAVGGITVKIKSNDPRGILDRNFDWNCPSKVPQSCYNVKYPNGPANLDGLHALYLARARGDDPEGRTYGLGGGNFDREQYQQKILIALKDKATSAGTLTNPVTITNLLDSLGKNVRTNISSEEVRSFIALAQETDVKEITRLTLVDKKKPLVTTGNLNGASIVQPVKGIYDYSGIRQYVLANISGDKSSIENATIDVRNGSGVAGAAQKKANDINAAGLKVVNVGNAPVGKYGSVAIYDLSRGKKPSTRQKLEQLLGVQATSGPLPSSVTSGAHFVIIVGTNGPN